MAKREVTQEQFFSALRVEESRGKDIMPVITNSTYPYVSDWVEHKKASRPLFGVTCGERYWLVSA